MPRVKIQPEEITLLAGAYDWVVESHNIELMKMTLRKINDFFGDCLMTIWYSKMVVRTKLNHPRHGITQMYRKGVDQELLETLLHNPRAHTNKGFIPKQFRKFNYLGRKKYGN